MLDDRQKQALGRWYGRSEVLDEARGYIERQEFDDLEELIHMRALLPLGRTSELPDYLRNDDGSSLLPSLNPRSNLEAWQDAIEVGWRVLEAELGLSQDTVHRAIARQQQEAWDSFLASVERRKREREPGSEGGG